jgi:hypothetical protein
MPYIKDVAFKILEQAGKPMQVKEITEHVLKEVKMRSRAPYKTVNAILQRYDKVKKVSRGMYAIKPIITKGRKINGK